MPRLCTTTRDLLSVRSFGPTSACILSWLESNTKSLYKPCGNLGSKIQDSKIQHDQPFSPLPSHRYTGTKQQKQTPRRPLTNPQRHTFPFLDTCFSPSSPADCHPHISQGTQQRPAQNVITRHRHAVHPCRNKRVRTSSHKKTKQAALTTPTKLYPYNTCPTLSNGHIIHPVPPSPGNDAIPTCPKPPYSTSLLRKETKMKRQENESTCAH